MLSISRRQCSLAVAVLGVLFSIGEPALIHAEDKPPPAAAPALDRTYVRAHYTKHEFRIPMRDGVKLFTAVYAPKDVSLDAPILLTRTPYGVKPYGVDNYRASLPYAAEGFIYAYQDVRGRYGSEGEFVDMRPHKPVKSSPRDIDESTDAYDTIDWLVRNVPHNSGRVGMMGISYPGFYTAAGMIDSHPALKCASPQAPIADCFMGDDVHHHGAFYLADNFSFFSSFGQTLDDPTRDQPKRFDFKNPDAYDFYLKLGSLENADKLYFKGRIRFWDDLMRHGTYDDFWRSRDLRPHVKNVNAAVMTVGGWYDAEDLFGTLATYRAVERNNPAATNRLVMGPWPHGGWSGGDGDRLGDISFSAKTAEFFRTEIEIPFLKHYLKDTSSLDLPKAYVFETGTAQWRRYDSWPPRSVHPRSLYFRAGGRLSFEPPASGDAAYDEYVSDPDKPVPSSSKIATGVPHDYMLGDQRCASSRPDVLVYQSDVLDDDRTIAGPMTARLLVSTSGTDSDWIVKLIDVYSGDYPNPEPNPAGVQMGGYQQLVRGEPMRGKFRNSYDKPEPFEPGRVTKVEWEMPDVCHTFRRGHRIMVQVQSSWVPLVDRNPQKFCDIYHAQAADFQKATERIYHSADAHSEIQVLELRSAN
jgi:putative CocE/NonD family hydrolase